jgi:NTP pyrophosphatase (non-canonical NTP hydrolase)
VSYNGDCALPSQAEALEFVRLRWPATVSPIWRAAKLAEEAGEVLGAVIKSEQGISGKTAADVAQETAQVVICALALAEASGFDLMVEVWREWRDCQLRTWDSAFALPVPPGGGE